MIRRRLIKHGAPQPKPKKISKAELARRARAAWWARPPWPCVIMSADPGEAAGASIIVSGPGGLELVRCSAIDLYHPSPLIEEFVEHACDIAYSRKLPMVGVLETWGRGGPRGLDQWIGLGEARGPWRRKLIQMTKPVDADGADRDVVITQSRIILARQTRWRSMVIPETGRIVDGKWEPFGPEGWKVIAKETAAEHFLESYVPPEDAAESACQGIYAARSDKVGQVLGKLHLKRHGLVYAPLEPTIFGKPSKAAG